jgi:hypothetical protein
MGAGLARCSFWRALRIREAPPSTSQSPLEWQTRHFSGETLQMSTVAMVAVGMQMVTEAMMAVVMPLSTAAMMTVGIPLSDWQW